MNASRYGILVLLVSVLCSLSFADSVPVFQTEEEAAREIARWQAIRCGQDEQEVTCRSFLWPSDVESPCKSYYYSPYYYYLKQMKGTHWYCRTTLRRAVEHRKRLATHSPPPLMAGPKGFLGGIQTSVIFANEPWRATIYEAKPFLIALVVLLLIYRSCRGLRKLREWNISC